MSIEQSSMVPADYPIAPKATHSASPARRPLRCPSRPTVASAFVWMFPVAATVCLSSCAPEPVNPNPYAGQLIFSGLRTAIMSVSGVSANEVYAVGADLGEGEGPNVLAFSGNDWRRLSTGIPVGDLWWISVDLIDGAFYLAGQPGLILRFDPQTRTFSRFDTPGTETLFGIWGTRDDELWAVGGDLRNPTTGGVLWRYDGSTWQQVDTTDLFPEGLPILYKIWGRSATEMYAVGFQCTALRFDGQRWSIVACDSNRSHFTVHGNADLVAAAGGFGDGNIAELIGGALTNVAPAGIPQMNGIYVPTNGTPVTVGNNASLATRTDGGWVLRNTELDTARDFHAVWVDPDGGVWAVGGNLGSALDDGIIAYFGSRRIPTTVVRD